VAVSGRCSTVAPAVIGRTTTPSAAVAVAAPGAGGGTRRPDPQHLPDEDPVRILDVVPRRQFAVVEPVVEGDRVQRIAPLDDIAVLAAGRQRARLLRRHPGGFFGRRRSLAGAARQREQERQQEGRSMR